MRRREIYNEMKRRSYSEAEEYKETCEQHGHSMSDYVQSWNKDDVADGCLYSHVGDESIDAARRLERDEYEKQQQQREEEEKEAERQRMEEYERQRQEYDMRHEEQQEQEQEQDNEKDKNKESE